MKLLNPWRETPSKLSPTRLQELASLPIDEVWQNLTESEKLVLSNASIEREAKRHKMTLDQYKWELKTAEKFIGAALTEEQIERGKAVWGDKWNSANEVEISNQPDQAPLQKGPVIFIVVTDWPSGTMAFKLGKALEKAMETKGKMLQFSPERVFRFESDVTENKFRASLDQSGVSHRGTIYFLRL